MEAARFGDLRGVQWRIDLGILPLSTIDHLRRVTADSRRRYASLRRQLLIDPHVPKDGSDSPDLVMDNPLSQNPDSMWGRFFRNAELERMVDQDLSRLYPEHGSYFQTPNCQAMLRRILLLWCLRHPEYGYRQGMHELLAPLLYVLQADTEYLSEVRNLYEDHFTDKFDGFSFHENDLTYKFDFKKFSEDDNGRERSPVKTTSLSELDPKVETVILSSDAYGVEGELGILISEKFMEHDAYCMFDALMSGAGGAVAMAEFFSHSRYGRSHTGYSPVIEASAALYHLLSQVDSPLHSHLVELGVEPQYFALRWLRVLFGREFALEDLLIIWDAIFGCDNKKLEKPCENDDAEPGFGVLNSSRGAFISAFAVAMILHLRSLLLATENATTCLQRLLNFPDDIDLGKLIAKAKSLQALAVEANNTTPPFDLTSGLYGRSQPAAVRGHSHSVDLSSPTTPLSSVVPESYWEEKWRVLLKEQESKQNSPEKQVPNRKKGWSEKVRARLTRTESDPTPSAVDNSVRKNPKSSVRRSLLKDLAQQLGADDEAENIIDENTEEEMPVEQDGNDATSEQPCSSGSAASEQNSSIFSDPPSPISGVNDHDNRSERSSVASNCSADENDAECNSGDASCTNLPLPIPDPPQETLVKSNEQNGESGGKVPLGLKERKLLSGKFQWLWKLGRNGGERTSEKGDSDSTKARNSGNNPDSPVVSSTADTSNNSGISKGESVDQNLMVSLRNLGQSMLENIQVIESVFQQERGQENAIVGKGQVTAMTALKELRKISNLLSEM